ncbi:MAG TPA: hypothetical protein VK731_03380, partial [Candidatus Cybelea sp.]|nr:hypothetical protein [Candidatus Cybelea sp.]
FGGVIVPLFGGAKEILWKFLQCFFVVLLSSPFVKLRVIELHVEGLMCRQFAHAANHFFLMWLLPFGGEFGLTVINFPSTR